MLNISNLKNLLISFIILIFISSEAFAKKYEFDNIIVFGDSLSDVGNYSEFYERRDNIAITLKNALNNISVFDYNFSVVPLLKFIAGDQKLYIEYLSENLTGKQNIPCMHGGTNCALSNSTSQYDDYTLSQMVDIYFNNIHKNTSNFKDSLFIVWSGGNDIRKDYFKYIISTLKSEATFNLIQEPRLSNNEYLLSEPHKEIASTVQILLDKGAPYVIVPNIFDASIAPVNILLPFHTATNLADSIFANKIMETILPFGLNKYPLALIYNLNDSMVSFIDLELRTTNTIPLIPRPGAGRELIREKIKHYYSYFPLVGDTILNYSDNANTLSQGFNASLENELEKINGNIVFVNIYQFVNELIDNPKIYGIDDIFFTQCQAGIFAADPGCKDEYHQNKHYLWSDLIHPSPTLHALIADYILSIIQAPLYASSMAIHLDSLNKNNLNIITNQLNFLEQSRILNSPTLNKIFPLVGISATQTNIPPIYRYDSKNKIHPTLYTGFSYYLNKNLLLGMVLNLSLGKHKTYPNFSYTFNSQILNFFTQYNFSNNLWSNLNLSLGRISIKDIKRSIPLGIGNRIETSRTNGFLLGLDYNLGYNFIKDNLLFTPSLGVSFNHYKIRPYHEKDDNSTSMRFLFHKINTSNLNIGFNLTTLNPKFNPYLGLKFNYSLNHKKPIKTNSALKSTKTSFDRELNIYKNNSLGLNLGFNLKIKKKYNLNSNLEFTKYQNNYKQLNFSVSLKF